MKTRCKHTNGTVSEVVVHRTGYDMQNNKLTWVGNSVEHEAKKIELCCTDCGKTITVSLNQARTKKRWYMLLDQMEHNE